MRHLTTWFMNLRIASKMIVCYFVMLSILLALGGFTYRQFQDLTTDKVWEMAGETTGSISSNLDFLLDSLNRQSLILLSSQPLQNTLDEKAPEIRLQNQLTAYLSDFMNFNDIISSIYIFSDSGVKYYVDSVAPKHVSLGAIRNSEWYPRLVGLNGGALLSLNGGETFSAAGETYVSLIRVINSTNTQKPVGLMMINVSSDYIKKTVTQGNANHMQVIVRDEGNRSILDELPEEEEALGDISAAGKDSAIRKINGENYIISTLTNRYGWRITSVTPFSELTKQVFTINVTLILFIIVIAVFFLATFLLISLLITKPIHKLAVSMKAAENGEFREIDIRTGNDEIGHLKDVYNMMVRKIVVLFDDIIREQAMKRKKELEVLQMQIKPHFLYNSFDSISSLALSGRNGDVYRLVRCLGKYYRSFLSACDEEVTVRKELEIVDSYLTIQEIRFPGKFTVKREIDERTLDCRFPSLTLQPLAENAVNHGIRGKPGTGVLTIRSLLRGDRLCISVEDDGVGMEPDKVREIMSGRSEGVGLRATMEKLRLAFNSDDLLEIESEKGRGTKITITLPARREDGDGR